MAPKIAFIVEGRYLRQEMPRAVIRELEARGLEPDVLCPHGAQFDPQSGIFSSDSDLRLDLNRCDVVVARCRDALGLAMLAYAETAHLLTINTRAATEQVRSKAEMAVALERAGVPSAPTVLASDVAVVAGLSEDWFPLLLKPTYGDNSQGLRLIRRRDDLWDVHWPEQLVVAQRYLPNDGFDLKFYVCGDRVFATRKPSPFNGDRSAVAQPFKPEAALVTPLPPGNAISRRSASACTAGERSFASRSVRSCLALSGAATLAYRAIASRRTSALEWTRASRATASNASDPP